MKLRERYVTCRPSVSTCLFVLLTLTGSVVTSQTQQTFLRKINNKRLDVTAQNVTTHSVTDCYVTCQRTSWCVTVNLSPDRRTCQLLSEETEVETSLQSADGWSHIRKCQSKQFRRILRAQKNKHIYYADAKLSCCFFFCKGLYFLNSTNHAKQQFHGERGAGNEKGFPRRGS